MSTDSTFCAAAMALREASMAATPARPGERGAPPGDRGGGSAATAAVEACCSASPAPAMAPRDFISRWMFASFSFAPALMAPSFDTVRRMPFLRIESSPSIKSSREEDLWSCRSSTSMSRSVVRRATMSRFLGSTWRLSS